MGLPASITVDDVTVEPTTGFGPDLTQRIAELAQYRVSRLKAEQWSYRSVKFLVFDETDVYRDDDLVEEEEEDWPAPAEERQEHEDMGYESDSSDAMLARAIAMSLEDDNDETQDIETQDVEADQAASSSSKAVKGKNPATALPGDDCESCQEFHDFPRHRKVRRFSIAQPPSSCSHFVCVSYCWPKDKDGNPIQRPKTKTITMMDGTERPNRAPDDVLDRAVEVARCYGLRMIWIDQECLPQDESEEQQLGVQAMDILYAQAWITAGLLDSTAILTQAQMDAIHMMSSFEPDPSGMGCRWRGRGPVPVVDASICNHVLDFLEMLTSDAYYTRAWIVQESLSAGDKMCLVLPKAPGVSDPFGADPYLANKRAHGWRRMSTNIHIPVHLFKDILAAARFLIDPPFVRYGDALVAMNGSVLPVSDLDMTETRDRARHILPKAYSLHPHPPKSVHISGILTAHGSGIDGPRQSCDTATALTLLKSRGCFRVEDRVAIVANMCGFDIRLNTFTLAQKCPSLRLAIFAQAFLNADYTIFVPELYRSPSFQMHGILSPFETRPHTIQSHAIRGPGHINWSNWRNNLEKALFTTGLGIPAYLWKTDRPVDLTPIKEHYSPLWVRLHCLSASFEPIDGESAELLAQRQNNVAQRLSNQQLMGTINRLLYRSSQGLDTPMPSLLSDAYCENGVLHLPGATVTSHVLANRIQSEPAMQEALGEIIFAILRYLVDINERGLASSIWQSVRVDARDRDDLNLPDDAGDALFALLDESKDPWSFLSLSRSVDGSFNELWFVDRIMRDGHIWAGSYVRSRNPNVNPEGEEERVRLGKGKHKDRARKQQGSILDRQLTRKILAITLQSARHSDDVVDDEHPIDRGSMINFMIATATTTWTVEAEDKRVAERVAAFDVDGPCVVATPFDTNWEMLPRPDVRSMSACWVVEPVEDVESDKSAVQDPVQDVNPQADVNAEQGEEQPRPSSESMALQVHRGCGSSNETDQTGGQEEPSSNRTEDQPEANFKVVNKVKGVWEIMDIPSQIYAFR